MPKGSCDGVGGALVVVEEGERMGRRGEGGSVLGEPKGGRERGTPLD